MTGLRRALDGLYRLSGALAACCLVAILVLIVSQMVARWTGEVFPGAAEYAGYCMAAASFLAFAEALNRGAHVRVSVVLGMVGPRAARWIDGWCLAVGTAVMWYVVWFGWRFVGFSWRFGDVSQGQDRTPLWMPQAVMLAGAAIFAVCLTDHLLTLVLTGRHRIDAGSDAAPGDQAFGE